MTTIAVRSGRLVAVLVTAVVVAAASGCSDDPAAEVRPVESVTSSEQLTMDLVECMQGKGWDATYEASDQSMSVLGVPPEQDDKYRSDNASCSESTGFDAPPPPLSDEQLTALYAHEVATAECLRGEGFSVPDASSEQSFKDIYASGQAYSAYAAVSEVDQETWNRINEVCPQLPEGF